MVNYKDIVSKIKPGLEKAAARFKEDLATFRTGRATPALIENVEVECYGSRVPLKQLAVITAPEARALLVQPWDKSSLKEIEKAILTSRSGLSVVNTGEAVRVMIPSLTGETRKNLIRDLRKILEEAKLNIRSLREQAWKELQEGERAGTIREDDKFRGKEELQKAIDEANKKLEDLSGAKEKEIMTI